MVIRDRAPGVGWKLPLLLCALLWPAAAGAQSLRPYVDGDQLHLRSSPLRLLSGEAKKQLRNGATVTFAFRVTWTATRGGEARNSFTYHCMFSFDLWEETYKVSRREPGARSASRLSEAAAEQQCMESLVIPVSVLPATAGFWLSVIYQMEERPTPSSADDSRSIPGVLVDIFSRRTPDNRPIKPVESGPFRLMDLPKAR
jgi:hypothetical protein